MKVEKGISMHIGLLEESAAIAELLCTVLQMAGHTASVHASAASLLEGMAICPEQHASQPYDFLILDVLIDTPDDLAFLAQLACTLMGQPLLVITASHSSQITRAKRAYPHIAFLAKPFHLEELSASIDRHIVRPTKTSATV